MAEFNLSNATTTDFKNTVPNFIVEERTLDIANTDGSETFVYFDDAPDKFGYYFSIPEIYSAVNALATWAFSRGWTTSNQILEQELKNVVGMGKDTFESIMWNHEVVKLIVGDSFIEVLRQKKGVENVITNMIPISPERVKVVIKGTKIQRYEIWNGSKWVKKAVEDILHSHNKRIGDQVRGTSQIDASKFVIDARNEALADERIIKHRDKALGIVSYKTNNAGKITFANTQIENAVKNGEMVGMPEETAEIKPWPSKSSEDRQNWISYLENFIYQVFGVPRSIATSDGTSEVGGKMGHVIFEPIYTKEQVDLEGDLSSQQQIDVTFNRPPSLGGLQPQIDESKNTGQLNIQPNDVTANLEVY